MAQDSRVSVSSDAASRLGAGGEFTGHGVALMLCD